MSISTGIVNDANNGDRGAGHPRRAAHGMHFAPDFPLENCERCGTGSARPPFYVPCEKDNSRGPGGGPGGLPGTSREISHKMLNHNFSME